MRCVIMKDQLPLIVLLILIAANNQSVTTYTTLSRTQKKDVAMNLSGNKRLHQMTAPCAQNVVTNRKEREVLKSIGVASAQNAKTVSG